MMPFSEQIKRAATAIREADCLIVGVGSGLSASGGLDYGAPELVERWYPEYFESGKRSLMELLGDFWPTRFTPETALHFWALWARHIQHVRFETGLLQPYADLYTLLKEKNYFICSTNVDGQLEKAGFPRERIFAPQGDYALFQCWEPCSQLLYPNREAVERMLAGMTSPWEIRAEDLPRCPRCGGYLVPNLRCDERFVEEPHLFNQEAYQAFLREAVERRTVLLELGVGYNTPGLIRFPFERITKQGENCLLVRVNRDQATVRAVNQAKTLALSGDCAAILSALM